MVGRTEALAIRRIRHHCKASTARWTVEKLGCIANLEHDVVKHASPLGIGLGLGDHVALEIAGHIFLLQRTTHIGVGCGQQLRPLRRVYRHPVLESERAIASGRHAARHLRSLDHDGASAATRIGEHTFMC